MIFVVVERLAGGQASRGGHRHKLVKIVESVKAIGIIENGIIAFRTSAFECPCSGHAGGRPQRGRGPPAHRTPAARFKHCECCSYYRAFTNIQCIICLWGICLYCLTKKNLEITLSSFRSSFKLFKVQSGSQFYQVLRWYKENSFLRRRN